MGEFTADGLHADGPDRIFELVCDAWALSDEERETLRQRALECEDFEGYLNISRIYRALHAIFSETEDGRADSWVRRPNRRFDGAPALEYMIEKPGGIAEVKGYVMGQVFGGW